MTDDTTKTTTHEYYEAWVTVSNHPGIKFSISEDKAARWGGIELRLKFHEMKQFRSLDEIVASFHTINRLAEIGRLGNIDWDNVVIHKHTVVHTVTEDKLRITHKV